MQLDPDAIHTTRGALALELIREGRAVQLDALSIRIADPNHIEVAIASTFSPANAPPGYYEREAATGVAQFSRLLVAWPELAALVGRRVLAFVLVHDYGNGSVLVGRVKPDGAFEPT